LIINVFEWIVDENELNDNKKARKKEQHQKDTKGVGGI
jgi:hypothetical protein